MAQPADDNARVSEQWEHSTPRQDSAQASSSFYSELHTPRDCQNNLTGAEVPFNVFATAFPTENLETDQTVSSSPEENSSDYENAWLQDYFSKIQDALHEELTHVEQEFNTAEGETTCDALDMSVPDLACFTEDKKKTRRI